MIYKWKHNYTDEEKSMALTIQNLKQEIDKLVDTNEDINREFSQYKYESKKEIERLNNIIKRLEEFIEKEIELYTLELTEKNTNALNYSLPIRGVYKEIYNVLQELKGEDKNDKS